MKESLELYQSMLAEILDALYEGTIMKLFRSIDSLPDTPGLGDRNF
jgi:hypothetical protein